MRFLAPHSAQECIGQESCAKLTICRSISEFPRGNIEVFRDYYKGLPWTLGISKGSDNVPITYYFYTPIFVNFLITRIFLIPYLKRCLAQQDGVVLIGSAFSYKDVTYIVTGIPGAGKTRLLLNALDLGAEFIGDDQLILTADGQIKSLSNLIQLRYLTAYDTVFWGKLSGFEKLKALCFHWISFFTAKKINFALTFNSRQLGIKKRKEQSLSSPVFLLISGNHQAEKIDARSFLEYITDYEVSYQKLFGKYIYSDAERDRSLELLSSIIDRETVLQYPAGASARDIIAEV
jgi:hypothetical protein